MNIYYHVLKLDVYITEPKEHCRDWVHAQNGDQNRIYLDVDRTGSLLISENFKGLW